MTAMVHAQDERLDDPPIADARYRAAFAALGQGMCAVRATPPTDGSRGTLTFLDENPAAVRIVGRSLVADSLGDAVADADAWIGAAARVARTGVAERFESRAGNGRRLDVRAFRADDAPPDEVWLLIDDVTNRSRSERACRAAEDRDRFLATLTDSLRGADSTGAMIAITARAARGWLNVGDVAVLEDDAAAPGDPDGPVLTMLRDGRAVRIDDVAGRDRAQPAGAFDMAGARALLAVPLVDAGRLVLTLVARHDAARAWSDDDVALATAALERLWPVVERARAEAARRRSERRLQTLVDGVPQLVWRAVDGGCWTWCSPQWSAFTGLDPEACAGWGWLEAVHPDDRAGAREFWRRAERDGQMLEMPARIRRGSDGSYRWFHTRALPERDAAGRIVEWLGTSTDVDDLRRLQERQRTLVGELQHRVRNILAVTRSVFGQSIASGRSLEEVIEHFKGRLDSLGRTQTMAAATDGGVDLENLIREELLSVGASDGPGLSIEGPEIALPFDQAQMFGLAIHELITNAIKFGALRAPGGKLKISWQTNVVYGEYSKLNLIWQEQGVPTVAVSPLHRGFGRELIEEALPYRHGAETRLEFRGGGVCCHISLPLPLEGASTAPAQRNWP